MKDDKKAPLTTKVKDPSDARLQIPIESHKKVTLETQPPNKLSKTISNIGIKTTSKPCTPLPRKIITSLASSSNEGLKKKVVTNPQSQKSGVINTKITKKQHSISSFDSKSFSSSSSNIKNKKQTNNGLNKIKRKNKMINLVIKTMMGTEFKIIIDQTQTIRDLKSLIYDQENISVESQLLVFRDQLLKNDFSSLSDLYIQNLSTLKLVVQMTGGPGSPAKLKVPIKDEDDSIVLLLCKQDEELFMLELHMKNAQQRREAAAQFFKLASVRPTSSTCHLLSELSGLTKEEIFSSRRDNNDSQQSEEEEIEEDFYHHQHRNSEEEDNDKEYDNRPTSSSSISSETFFSLINASSISSLKSRPCTADDFMDDKEFEEFSKGFFYRSAPMSAKSMRVESISPKNTRIKIRPATAICLMRLPESFNSFFSTSSSLSSMSSRPSSSKFERRSDIQDEIDELIQVEEDLEEILSQIDYQNLDKIREFKTLNKKSSFLSSMTESRLNQTRTLKKTLRFKDSSNQFSNKQINIPKTQQKQQETNQFPSEETELTEPNPKPHENDTQLLQFTSRFTQHPNQPPHPISKPRAAKTKPPSQSQKGSASRPGTRSDQQRNLKPKTPKRSATPPVLIKNRKCFGCGKKLGLAGSFKCKCGEMFCSVHRYSDRHECGFDYRENGKILLVKQNPLVSGEKVLKI